MVSSAFHDRGGGPASTLPLLALFGNSGTPHDDEAIVATPPLFFVVNTAHEDVSVFAASFVTGEDDFFWSVENDLVDGSDDGFFILATPLMFL